MRLAVADVVEGVVLEANQQRALPAFGPAGRASQGMMLVTYMDHPLWFFIFFFLQLTAADGPWRAITELRDCSP